MEMKRARRATIAILSAALLVATLLTSRRASSAGDPFADGYNAYKSRDYTRAVEQLKLASESNPTLADYALFYLARAQRAQGETAGAAAAYTKLVQDFPQSVLTPRAMLELSQAQLKLGLNDDAAAAAARLVAIAPDEALERQGRVAEARALLALGKFKPAYDEATKVRSLSPRSDEDIEARTIAYEILGRHPEVEATETLDYHRSEAALLIEEGQLDDARTQARAALAFEPSPEVRAELTWIVAQSYKSNPSAQKRELLAYLTLAPHGPAATRVLAALGLLYWHDEDYAGARAMFNRLATDFPSSELAPEALYRIGRIYEEEKKFDAARATYRRLDARYPRSDEASDGRFRIGWTFYMARRYGDAAEALRHAHTDDPQERDMFAYWRARSLEKSGQAEAARQIFAKLAGSTDTNYYPELASRRLGGVAVDLPAASAPDPAFSGVPPIAAPAEFHLRRWQALRTLGLKDLEPAELQAIAAKGGNSRSLRMFVLAGLENAGAWYDAITTATKMAAKNEIGHDEAERVRYPRAYWDLFAKDARQRGLDPLLVVALARQESLFNPFATSVSNARGLMQLMSFTARREAPEAGIDPENINLFDPNVNVALGTTYLKNLMQLFAGNEFHVVAAYNGGEHAVQKWMAQFPGDNDEWVENIGYKQTRNYVKRVIGGRREYQLLYPQTSGASQSGAATRSSG